MRTCLGCQQPIPTLQDVRQERRRDWTRISVVVLLVAIIAGSIGYGVRDSIFLKRENGTLSRLLDSYVKRVETDKLVEQNQGLKLQLRAQRGSEKKRGE